MAAPGCAVGSVLILLLLLLKLSRATESSLTFCLPHTVILQHDSLANVSITASSPPDRPYDLHLNVTFSSRNDSLSIITLPEQVVFPASVSSVDFPVSSHSVGQVTASLLSNHTEVDRTHFMVVHSVALEILSDVIGWIYFLAWSVSFYPQAYENWRRKSVVGLNFDFLALNISGFIAYSVFNIGLFWVVSIKEEYLRANPTGINPVSVNDVFFSLHAVLLCSIYICQAAVYQRAGQAVSKVAGLLLLGGWSFALVSLCLAAARRISWLSFLYRFSYLKLAVTLVKYVPQAIMNYRRKSTEGWSIGNVLLDFTGGVLSILQMILQSYNNDEWRLIFGNPTKFGLGLFSVVFDVLFMVQHYCLYRGAVSYQPVTGHDH